MSDKQIILKEENSKIEQAQAITIKDAQGMLAATSLLSELNKANDRITKEKEKITKPLNEALKVERARWKPAEVALETAINAVRSKMSAFQTEKFGLAKIEENKIANRIGEGKGKIKIDTAIRKIGEIETPEAKVKTDAGSVSFRPVKKFEVIDIITLANAAPLAVLPNDVFIRKQNDAGIELPGVKYWVEQTVINKR